MRFFLTGWIILTSSAVIAQDKNDNLFLFRGYIFSEDSVPVENAYLINYRTTKIVATESNGRFSVYVREDDSLMINHLSLQPLVIRPLKGTDSFPVFYVAHRIYEIKTVTSTSLEYYYFKQNVLKIRQNLNRAGLQHTKSPRGSDNNPYNPDKTSLGLTTTPGDIIQLFKKKKK